MKIVRCWRCNRPLKPWEIYTCGRCLRALKKSNKDTASRRCFGSGKKKGKKLR